MNNMMDYLAAREEAYIRKEASLRKEALVPLGVGAHMGTVGGALKRIGNGIVRGVRDMGKSMGNAGQQLGLSGSLQGGTMGNFKKTLGKGLDAVGGYMKENPRSALGIYGAGVGGIGLGRFAQSMKTPSGPGVGNPTVPNNYDPNQQGNI